MDEQVLKWLGAVAPLATLFEAELQRQQQATGRSREEILAEAAATWSRAEGEAAELLKLRRASDDV